MSKDKPQKQHDWEAVIKAALEEKKDGCVFLVSEKQSGKSDSVRIKQQDCGSWPIVTPVPMPNLADPVKRKGFWI